MIDLASIKRALAISALVLLTIATPRTVALAQSTDEKAETVSEALDQIRDGKVNLGVQSLLELANGGNADAFFHLGQIYALGAGRTRSVSVAAMYFRLAGQLGHQRAELSLANLLFFEGEEGAQLEEALQIYRQYAIAGEPEALYVMGLAYWNGDVTGESDPVRGYGLVWLASERGYTPAAEAELEMNGLLSFEARRFARKYAENLKEQGITDDLLAPELVDSETSDDDTLAEPDVTVSTPDATEQQNLETMADWEDVWRVEVGAASSREAANRLSRIIGQKMGDDAAGLQRRVIQMPDQPDRFKILYGPLDTFQDAVLQCVKFKARGYDCFSRAPN